MQPDYIKIAASRLVPRDRLIVGSREYRLTDTYRVRRCINAETESGELFSWWPDTMVTVHRQTHQALAAESVSTST